MTGAWDWPSGIHIFVKDTFLLHGSKIILCYTLYWRKIKTHLAYRYKPSKCWMKALGLVKTLKDRLSTCKQKDKFSLNELNLTMLVIYKKCMYLSPSKLYERATIIHLGQAEWNSIDPDQLAFKKPADLDLHCFKTEYMFIQVSMVRVKTYVWHQKK